MLRLILMSMLFSNVPGMYAPGRVSAPAYLSRADQHRWQHVRGNKMLYRGHHAQYFLAEGRTRFNYKIEEIEGVKVKRYITVNLCKLVANTTADLMFNAQASITAKDPTLKKALDDLSRRSLIHARFREAAVQMSWSGGGFLEASIWNGEVYLEIAPADQIYPQGRPTPDGQYTSYIRYATDCIYPKDDPKAEPTRLLLKTIYSPGMIQRQLSQLDKSDGIAKENLQLDQWPAFGADPKKQEEKTGIDQCTIIYLANSAGDETGVSDFENLESLQDSVNAKTAQTAGVIAKHADPKIHFPETSARQDGNVVATHDAFYGEESPEYIVWEAQLDPAMADRKESILAFFTTAEMSPVLAGIRFGAAPDAARKLRLEATKDLARVNRKNLVIQPAIALALEVAARLDQTTPLLKSYPVDQIGVAMRDGLPSDPVDDANAAQAWRAADLMSIESGVAMRYPDDPDGAAKEVALIKAESAAKVPSIFGGPTAPGNTAEETGDDKPDAAANATAADRTDKPGDANPDATGDAKEAA